MTPIQAHRKLLEKAATERRVVTHLIEPPKPVSPMARKVAVIVRGKWYRSIRSACVAERLNRRTIYAMLDSERKAQYA